MSDKKTTSRLPRNLHHKIKARVEATGEPWHIAKKKVLEQHLHEQPPAHSDSWFRRLDILNHQQAAYTQRITQLAGSTLCCSICGDLPSAEYRPQDDRTGLLIRLCDDCVQIRAAMYGERFVRPGRAESSASEAPAQQQQEESGDRVEAIEEWVLFPELALGTFVVTNVGFLVAPIGACRRAGVQGIPTAAPAENVTTLPTVAVMTPKGPTVRRLPLDFGPIARAMWLEARRIYEEQGAGLLPGEYEFGFDHRGAFVVPKTNASRAIDLSVEPLPPPQSEDFRPWRLRK